MFTIGNYVLQRLLRPIHDWLGDVGEPMFDQTKPLDNLVGEGTLFSFDL